MIPLRHCLLHIVGNYKRLGPKKKYSHNRVSTNKLPVCYFLSVCLVHCWPTNTKKMEKIQNEVQKIGEENRKIRTNARKSLWIFGYGSVLWKTGFKYHTKILGYIRGYDRVFWQGNITHRGSFEKPGRVATLTPNSEGVVWGAAYQVIGEAMINDATVHLNSRECKLGGYTSATVTFYPRNCYCHTIDAVIFLAKPGNQYYLGTAPTHSLAEQILECSGPSGSNTEYVLLLARFLKNYIPEANGTDRHLDELEEALLALIHSSQKCLEDLVRTHLISNSLVFKSCPICLQKEYGSEE